MNSAVDAKKQFDEMFALRGETAESYAERLYNQQCFVMELELEAAKEPVPQAIWFNALPEAAQKEWIATAKKRMKKAKK